MSTRKLRGHFTGGVKDIHDFHDILQVVADAKGWSLTWEEEKPFGDVGPLHKLTFGYELQEGSG